MLGTALKLLNHHWILAAFRFLFGVKRDAKNHSGAYIFDLSEQGGSSRVVLCEERKMLACIACSTKDGGEDGSRAAATPHGRDAGKSLTSQVCLAVLASPHFLDDIRRSVEIIEWDLKED
jgi:hypothetical protein